MSPNLLSSLKREALVELRANHRPQVLRQTSLLDVFKQHDVFPAAALPTSEATSGDSIDVNLDDSDEDHETLQQPRKRARFSLDTPQVRKDSHIFSQAGLSSAAPLFTTPTRRLTNHGSRADAMLSSFGLMTRMSLLPAHKLGHAGVQARRRDLTEYMQSFVSSNASDVYRCESLNDYRHHAPPFACAYSNDAKAGGKQILATATEEGIVSLIDTSKSSDVERTTTRTSIQAHQNAIFDISWSLDDAYIATASGDQSLSIIDVETQQTKAKATGHLSTIKQVVWDPQQGGGSSVLATGSRDGTVRIWDMRTRIDKSDEDEDMDGDRLQIAVEGINLIQNAHGLKAKSGKGLKTSRTAVRSVTSIAYLKHRDHLVASAGSADGIIKVWDLRKSHSRRINPVPYLASPDHAFNNKALNPASRTNGISSIELSPCGTALYAMSTSHAIYSLEARDLSASSPLKVYTAPTTDFASFRVGTFYVKLALSPATHPLGPGRFLTAGSTDGSVWMWDTEGHSGRPVALAGHQKEVGALSWSNQGFVTCSDDYTIRKWSSDIVTKRKAEEDKPTRWHYGGNWPIED